MIWKQMILNLFIGVLFFYRSFAWESTNPGGGGALNSPIICGNYWIIGSDLGGLYISTNEGAGWYAVGSNKGLLATHIASLACSQSKLYVGTDDGIFVGDLNGSNMKRVLAGGYIASLVVSSRDQAIIYAGRHDTFDGTVPTIFRSNDGGGTFNQMTASGLPNNLRIVAMRSHPVDPNGVWVLSGEGRFGESAPGAFFSTDGGSSFIRLQPPTGRLVDVAYAFDQSNLNKLYATTESDSAGHLFLSLETGFGQWREIVPPDTGGITGIILADATNSDRVRIIDFNYRSFTSETLLWESQNGGDSWTRSSNIVSGGWSQADEVWGLGSSFQGQAQTIGYRPDKPNLILWSNSQFVYKSCDGGKTWSDTVSRELRPGHFQSRGLDNVVPIVVEPSQADGGLVFAGYLDLGIWRSDDGGSSWMNLNPDSRWTHNWDAKGGNTLSIAADPSRSNVVWAQVAGDLDDPIHLLKSQDRGNSWFEITQGLPANPRILESIKVDPSSPANARRLALVADGDIYVSADDGLSWSRTLACGDCVGVRYISPNVFAFGPQGIWRSQRRGSLNSWEPLVFPFVEEWTPGQHWLQNSWTYVGPIDMDGKGSSVFLCVLRDRQGGLYSSTNMGNSWNLVYQNNNVRSVSLDPQTGEILVGTSSALQAGGNNADTEGILIHPNGLSSDGWIRKNQGLVWNFGTFVTTTASGDRWAISPGQGIMKDKSTPAPNPVFCFSGKNFVNVLGKGMVRLADVEVGEHVQISTNDFARVYSFGHKSTDVRADFLQIYVENQSAPLEISPEHLLVVFKGGRQHFVRAAEVNDGDLLTVATGAMARVGKIRLIRSTGVFAPFTTSGTIMINGILASSYVSFQQSNELKIGSWPTISYHWLSHRFTAGQRIIFQLGVKPPERYTKSGEAEWASISRRWLEWLLSCHPLMIALSLVCVFCVLGILWVVEVMISSVFPLLVLVASILLLGWNVTSQRKMKISGL